MANEVRVTLKLEFDKGSASVKMPEGTAPLTLFRNVTGAEYLKAFQPIGAAAEAIVVGDVAAGGYVMVKNTHASDDISLRDGSGGTNFLTLKPGDAFVFRLATGVNFHAIGTASLPVLEILAIDA